MPSVARRLGRLARDDNVIPCYHTEVIGVLIDVDRALVSLVQHSPCRRQSAAWQSAKPSHGVVLTAVSKEYVRRIDAS